MLVKIPNSEAISMLESNNQIKGSILSFSANLKAEKFSNVHMIRDFTDVIEKYSIGTALIANTQFYNENQDICEAIRVMIAGRLKSPDLFSIMKILGKERILNRIELYKSRH